MALPLLWLAFCALWIAPAWTSVDFLTVYGAIAWTLVWVAIAMLAVRELAKLIGRFRRFGRLDHLDHDFHQVPKAHSLVSALRVFLAVLVLGLGVAGAVAIASVVKESRETPPTSLHPFGSTEQATPSWAIPVAVVVGFVGLAGSAAILASGYRRDART